MIHTNLLKVVWWLVQAWVLELVRKISGLNIKFAHNSE